MNFFATNMSDVIFFFEVLLPVDDFSIAYEAVLVVSILFDLDYNDLLNWPRFFRTSTIACTSIKRDHFSFCECLFVKM